MSVALDLFDAVESHALASGLFDAVNTHEPKAAPGSGLSCSVWLQNIAPAQGGSGLNQTSARIELSVRLYTNMITEPADMIDPDLLAACIALMEDYSGDFELSSVSSVRAIDLLGTYGTGLSSDAGYLNLDGQLYRVITITLPIVVNDLWQQTA